MSRNTEVFVHMVHEEARERESVYYIYPAARADEHEVDVSSGASDRAPRAYNNPQCCVPPPQYLAAT